MKFISTFVQLVDRQIVAANRKRNFKSLISMSDRELEDIGLTRECLYAESANQRRHIPTANNAVTKLRQDEHAA